ncbi:MAG: hypothetical protein HQK49_11135 [Oligoflexia bacterium]|nr:hypothetical protein [Oligoflexia bacterium]
MINYKDLSDIKIIKFFLVVGLVIIFAHRMYWNRGGFSPEHGIFGALSSWLLAIAPVISILPGLLLSTQLNNYFVGNRIYGFPFAEVLKVSIILFFVGSIRSFAKVSDTDYFFSWSILHFVGLSYVVIVLCSYVSIYFLIILSLLIFIFTNPLYVYYAGWMSLVSPGAMPLFLKDNWILLWVLIVELFFGGIFTWWIVNFKKISKKIKFFFVSLLWLILCFCGYQIGYKIYHDNYFAYHIFTLSKGIFFKAEVKHSYSLFPWFTAISFGFVLGHLYLTIKNRVDFYILSLLLFSLLSLFLSSSFVSILSDNGILMISQIQREVILSCFVFLILFVLASFVPIIVLKRFPLLDKIVDVYGNGIFVIYILMPITIIPIMNLLSKINFVKNSSAVSIIIFCILAYVLSYIFSRLKENQIMFNFSKKTNLY